MTWRSCATSGALACLAAVSLEAAEPLPALHADTRELTVSGVSSGGFMAVQLQVAHSARVKGVGALAAGPYYCAQGSLWRASRNCMSPGAWTPVPSVAVLRERTVHVERTGAIDATTNLAGAKVWLFSGRNDRTVAPEVTVALREYYRAFGTTPVLVADKPAGHAMVTENAGNACAAMEPPYINDCDYDAAGKLLAHLLGPLKPHAAPEGRLIAFDQSPFGALRIGLADSGYVYVPRACDEERCRVHVALHGCRQNAEAVGDRFARDAGYNRWAEGNRLIVLYPQTAARNGWSFPAGNFVWNPRACWDWWGYTGAAYHTREAPQIRAILAMVERLSAPRK